MATRTFDGADRALRPGTPPSTVEKSPNCPSGLWRRPLTAVACEPVSDPPPGIGRNIPRSDTGECSTRIDFEDFDRVSASDQRNSLTRVFRAAVYDPPSPGSESLGQRCAVPFPGEISGTSARSRGMSERFFTKVCGAGQRRLVAVTAEDCCDVVAHSIAIKVLVRLRRRVDPL